MFNLGTGEVFVILLVALIVLGPDKLPQAARKIGQTVSELRRMSAGFQSELRDAMQEPMQEPVLRGPTTGSFERSDGMPLKSDADPASAGGDGTAAPDETREPPVTGPDDEPAGPRPGAVDTPGQVTATDEGGTGNDDATT